MADSVAEHDASIAEAAKDLEGLKAQRAAVDQKLKETEAELRELVRSNPQIVQSLANFRPS
eukprot:gene17814-24195_t